MVKFYSAKIPFARHKGERLGQLLQKVIWEAARQDERREFQDLWIEKVEEMLLRRKDIDQWLIIEEGVR
jgi:hypothetical protein